MYCGVSEKKEERKKEEKEERRKGREGNRMSRDHYLLTKRRKKDERKKEENKHRQKTHEKKALGNLKMMANNKKEEDWKSVINFQKERIGVNTNQTLDQHQPNKGYAITYCPLKIRIPCALYYFCRL